jgi:transposase-like protein
MKCPNCQSSQIRKNGHRRGKQNHHCKQCNRQFINEYTERGYPNEVKQNCLRMYVNGLGFRGIERVTGVNHNTVIRWVRASARMLPNAPTMSEIPEITEIDELQTYVGKKAVRPQRGFLAPRTRTKTK